MEEIKSWVIDGYRVYENGNVRSQEGLFLGRLDYFNRGETQSYVKEISRLNSIIDGLRSDLDFVVEKAKVMEGKLQTPYITEVIEELANQYGKWGEQNHDPFFWMTVLGEEFGELCKASLHTRFGGEEAGRMEAEAIQVSAVALAILASLQRDKWDWSTPRLKGIQPTKKYTFHVRKNGSVKEEFDVSATTQKKAWVKAHAVHQALTEEIGLESLTLINTQEVAQ